MKKTLTIAITLLVGLTVLAGYFFQEQLGPVLGLVFEWGLILMGAAGLVGIGFLVARHVRKLFRWQKGSLLSVSFIAAFLLALVAGFVLTPQSALYRDLILNVQVPVEASLLAVLAVTLLYASLRLIRVRGWTPMAIAFLISAIFSLILNLGWVRTASGSLAAMILSLLERLPLAGARGILLGMALGGLVMGLRYLLAVDRPDGGA